MSKISSAGMTRKKRPAPEPPFGSPCSTLERQRTKTKAPLPPPTPPRTSSSSSRPSSRSSSSSQQHLTVIQYGGYAPKKSPKTRRAPLPPPSNEEDERPLSSLSHSEELEDASSGICSHVTLSPPSSPVHSSSGGNSSPSSRADSGVNSDSDRPRSEASSRGSIRSCLSSNRVSQDSLNEENVFGNDGEEESVNKTLRNLRAALSSSSPTSQAPSVYTDMKIPPPPPEFSDFADQPLSLFSSSASFLPTPSGPPSSGGASHLELLQQARGTLRRRESSMEIKQLEKSLTDRLHSFHVSEGSSTTTGRKNVSSSSSSSSSSAIEDEETFAGVLVVSGQSTASDKEEQRMVLNNGQDLVGDRRSSSGSCSSGSASVCSSGPPSTTVTIRSKRGTVRGVKNRVRQGIATFLRDPNKKVCSFTTRRTNSKFASLFIYRSNVWNLPIDGF